MTKEQEINDAKPKKKHKKAIIITSCIIGTLGVLAFPIGFWFGYVSPSMTKNIDFEEGYSRWMSYIKDDTKLGDLVMPGSHDAGSVGMMPQAMTQGHNYYQQLKGGVRYFDTRVKAKGDDLVIFHGPITGQKFDNVLHDVKTFISENPSEFIILDFQHIGKDCKDDIYNKILEILPKDCILEDNNIKLHDITFKDIRDAKKNVALIFKADKKMNTKDNEAKKLFTRENQLDSPYEGSIHKFSDDALIDQLDKYLESNDRTKLFVLQTQRTAKSLLGKPSLYEANFDKEATKYVKDLANKPNLLKNTNIIMRDFIISEKHKIDTILDLNNTKGLYK